MRRSLFLALGMVGIGLLISRPQMLNPVDLVEANIVTLDARLVDSLDHKYYNVYDFLQSDDASRTSTIHVHGLGLSIEELEFLKNYKIIFHPSRPKDGIIGISMPIITEGESWELSGQYQGSSDIQSILLTTPDGQRHVSILTDSTFTCRTVAPVAGDYIFDIDVILMTGDTISEVLPVKITHRAKWDILVLASYPTFEINHLKNHWASMDNGFAMRLKIAKDKYHSSFINMDRQDLSIIDHRVMNQYDFLLTDINSWNLLATTEQNTILYAIREKGLGLIFLSEDGDNIATRLLLPKCGKPKKLELPTSTDDLELLHFPLGSHNWHNLRHNKHIVAAYQSRGLGHVMQLGIADTYRLLLADESQLYQKLWAKLFSTLYRDFSTSTALIGPSWIWENDLTHFQLLSPDALTNPLIHHESALIPVLETPFLAKSYEFSLYPVSGYNEISGEGQDIIKIIYAHDIDQWAAMRQFEYFTINSLTSSRDQKNISDNKLIAIGLSNIWGYLLTIIGFSILWLDERII